MSGLEAMLGKKKREKKGSSGGNGERRLL